MKFEQRKFKVKGCNTIYQFGFLNNGEWPITWTNSSGEERSDRKTEHFVLTNFESGDWYFIDELGENVQPEEYTGGSSSYYKVDVLYPTTVEVAYQAECNDIIEALGLTFTEGNIFKAIWRIAADRNGKKKKGNNSVYDAEKVVFFAERLLIQEKSKQ